MKMTAIITLTTDFGLKDGNVGVMKGVILAIAPHAPLVDISHLIPPQNVREASLILRRSAPYFPPDTVHVVVVDPGVGTARRPIAARLGSQYFVGPDNGILTLLLEYAEERGWLTEFVYLDQPQFWRAEISHVFHGRDIFAPAAAHLANGKPLLALGSPIRDPLRLILPRPGRAGNVLSGEIIHIDHFGNLAANIRQEHLQEELAVGLKVSVHLAGAVIHGLARTFGDRPPGALTALWGSTGSLIISVVNGSAAETLHVQVGDAVQVVVED